MRSILFLIALILTLSACRINRPVDPFAGERLPPPPDYTRLDSWAAHPGKDDPADRTPGPEWTNEQGKAAVDVFFLYPTSFLDRKDARWNASLDDAALNEKTAKSSILYQASIFNGAGRVFAPHYRQAHYRSFFTADKASAGQALETAYRDVLASFDHYLKTWNQGRPFIIAGHSQGARHGIRLLRERVAGTPLQERLVAAYLVGWPVQPDSIPGIAPCTSPDQTGCYCSWRTFERTYGRSHLNQPEIVCTNPLTWTTEEGRFAPKSANLGAVLRKFTTVYPGVADAEVYRGYLLCSKPKFPGSILLRTKNYHIGDLNLYYMNVRENARLRAEAFLRK
jgi:hypothetical protein